MGSLRVRHDWATSLALFTIMHWRRKWQPTPVFLPGESQGQERHGLSSVGSHRVGNDWSDLAAAAYIIYTYDIFFIHLSIDKDKCFSIFWLLWIMSQQTINSGIEISLWNCDINSFAYIPRSRNYISAYTYLYVYVYIMHHHICTAI